MAFPALVPRRPGADTVVAGLLGRAALCGVPAEVEALDLHLLESASMRRNANHLSQAIAAHLHDHYRRAHQRHLYQELGA